MGVIIASFCWEYPLSPAPPPPPPKKKHHYMYMYLAAHLFVNVNIRLIPGGVMLLAFLPAVFLFQKHDQFQTVWTQSYVQNHCSCQ